MKNLFKTILILLIIICVNLFGKKATNTVFADSYSSENGGAFVDFFNNGELDNIWEFNTSESQVYEGNGVLNIELGPIPYGGVKTKEFILKGDADAQVSFQLSPNFQQSNSRAVFELSSNPAGEDWNNIMLWVGEGGYHSWEIHWPSHSISPEYFFESSDLEGKLRIKKVGSQITTYYWKNGWQQLTQWNSEKISPFDNLLISLWADTGDASSSHWVKWDNLVTHYHQ